MHVLIIGDAGGSHVRNRALAVARAGHKVSIVSPRPSGSEELDERVAMGAPGSLGQLIKHYRLINNCPGDIVHIHYPASLGAWLFLIGGRRMPMIAIAMGGDVLFKEQPFMPALAQWMTWNVLAQAHRIVVTGKHMNDATLAMGIPADKTISIRWGIDPNRFRPLDTSILRSDLGIHENQKISLSPRILKPFYNHHLIIEGMSSILTALPKARLLIAEVEVDEDYKKLLVEMIERLGVGMQSSSSGKSPMRKCRSIST